MSLDAATRSGAVAVPARVHRRRGVVLVAVAAFQFWLWGTRISNLVRDADANTAAFVGVHLALYVVAIGVGLVVLAMGVRLIREARTGRSS